VIATTATPNKTLEAIAAALSGLSLIDYSDVSLALLSQRPAAVPQLGRSAGSQP
jgi:hypothetical protein